MDKKSKSQQGCGMFVLKNINNTNVFPLMQPPDPEKTTPIILDKKSDEEIISEYGDIKVDNSTKARRFKNVEKRGGSPPRPLNSYFLYMRQETSKPEYKGMPAEKRSKIIGKRWRNESKKVTEAFYAAARVAKKEHAEKYKGYQFKRRPRKVTNRNKLKRDGSSIPPKTEPGPSNSSYDASNESSSVGSSPAPGSPYDASNESSSVRSSPESGLINSPYDAS